MDEHPLDDESPPRRSMLAGLVGDALVPGLGHLYLGAVTQAVVLAALYVVVVPGIVVAMVGLDRDIELAAWLMVAGAYVLRLLAALHAGVLAKRAVSSEPGRYQTRNAYLLFAAVVLSLGYLGSQQLHAHVLEPLVIPADSGLPNLADGDRIAVSKLHARDREPARGDLVSFPVPGDGALFVKRVVALEGETVAVAQGIVSIDGVPLAISACESLDGLVFSPAGTCLRERTPEGASYAIQLFDVDVSAHAFPPTQVPPGHVFVLGDNRLASHDSRAFGPVPISSITGRARAIWAPLERMRSLDAASP